MESVDLAGRNNELAYLISKASKELKRKYKQKSIKVIATGGYANLINKILKNKMKIEPQLTLKGLQIIAKEVFGK